MLYSGSEETRGLFTGSLPKEVGVHVGINICAKSPKFAALAMAVDKPQEAALHHAVYSFADIYKTAWGSLRG
jgi:hypothetical protein